jgi:FkbM family methyltransferase
MDELSTLRAKYPGEFNSERGEEWIIRDFFGDRRAGVFVDVGANHYQRFSNTYFLETSLGWSGVAIEPQTAFAADYAKYRPRTAFVPLFVADTSNQNATLYVPSNNLVASSDRTFAEQEGGSAVEIQARTTTLDDVLTRLQIDRIDFLSMDIELAEPAALEGFSIDRFRPALVGIEGHPPIRQQILDYFARHGYVIVGRYLRADSRNLWFTPLAGLGGH